MLNPSKRELDVQTKTSTAIFVDPISKDKRKVYAEIRSSVMEFDRRALGHYIREQFENNANGYTITDDPEEAQYLMSVFVLNLEKSTREQAESALKKGFIGGAIVGAGAGAATGKGIKGAAAGGAAGGALGGIVTTMGGLMFQDVYYMLVADVQIKEKTDAQVFQKQDMQAKTSDEGSMSQRVSERTNKKEYRTRVVTTANKVNLVLEEAQELMFQKTAYALSGFF